MVADEVAKVIGTPEVTAFLDHGIETAGGQRGEFLQGLTDEGQVEIDVRRTRRADARQTGLAQDALDAAMMNVQLPGYGADAPFLDVVVAQDMGFSSGVRVMERFSWAQANVKGGVSDDAESHGARTALAAGHRNGSAKAVAMSIPEVCSD